MPQYAHPEVLVDSEWLASHLSDPKVRVVEVDVDTAAYDLGHIPGAIGWNWSTQLADQVRRDILSKSKLEELLSNAGISPDTTPRPNTRPKSPTFLCARSYRQCKTR